MSAAARASALVALLLGAVVAVMLALAVVVSAADGVPEMPACVTEDSEQCYWDAGTMGNGTGRDFIRWDGVTYYADGSER